MKFTWLFLYFSHFIFPIHTFNQHTHIYEKYIRPSIDHKIKINDKYDNNNNYLKHIQNYVWQRKTKRNKKPFNLRRNLNPKSLNVKMIQKYKNDNSPVAIKPQQNKNSQNYSSSKVSSEIFKIPTSETHGWHPICFNYELRNQLYSFSFIDGDFILWKSKDKHNNDVFNVVRDVCPHMGSRLIYGKLTNGCIECPYHGLKIGSSVTNKPSDGCDVTLGQVKEHQGIIWWNPYTDDKSNKLFPIPHCEYLDDPSFGTVSTLRLEIDASFNDCWRNGADFHHPGTVHRNSFGNKMDNAVKEVKEQWVSPSELQAHFTYESNQKYSKRTGTETKNMHAFCLPSTTYNRVSLNLISINSVTNSNNEKTESKIQKIINTNDTSMVIHVAMRGISENKTLWLITARSNFGSLSAGSSTISQMLLKTVLRQVAQREDAVQLAKMASDKYKRKYAYKVKLPLDNIFEYLQQPPALMDAEDLEKQITQISKMPLNAPEIVRRITPYCMALAEFNKTIYPRILMDSYISNKWTVTAAHYHPPFKVQTIEEANMYYTSENGYEVGTATETTHMSNGSIFVMSADFRMLNQTNTPKGESHGYFFNLSGTVFQPDGTYFKPGRLPFDAHGFCIRYVSPRMMVRVGSVTHNWEVFTRHP